MARILLVEDDPLMSRMFLRLFRSKGFEIDLAEDGEDALEQINKKQPDLILLDVMMPKMDGLKLLDLLKSDENLKQIKIVLLTNLGVQEEIDKAIAKGVIKYIAKSEHDPVAVVEMVKEILDS